MRLPGPPLILPFSRDHDACRALPAMCAVLLTSLAVGPRLVAQQPRVVEHPVVPGSIVVPDEMQPDTLPALPPGMTIATLQAGDSLFHGRAGCFGCHGIRRPGITRRWRCAVGRARLRRVQLAVHRFADRVGNS